MTSSSIETSQTRRFGVVALVFFGCLCALGIWTKRPVPTYLFGAPSTIGFAFILFPSRLKPVHGAWLKIAHFIGKVLTVLILTVAYYVVISPAAVIKRLVSGSPLPLMLDRNVASYWVPRNEPLQPRERFIKRY